MAPDKLECTKCYGEHLTRDCLPEGANYAREGMGKGGQGGQSLGKGKGNSKGKGYGKSSAANDWRSKHNNENMRFYMCTCRRAVGPLWHQDVGELARGCGNCYRPRHMQSKRCDVNGRILSFAELQISGEAVDKAAKVLRENTKEEQEAQRQLGGEGRGRRR